MNEDPDASTVPIDVLMEPSPDTAVGKPHHHEAPHHEAPHNASLADGARFAVTTFTIARVRPGAVNRGAARIAMALAPAVGILIGAIVGGLAIGLNAIPCPPPVTGLICVGALAGLTRGLHLDGLADTADGLGSYQPPGRALAIMQRPEVGPLGVVAILLAVAIPAACIMTIVGRPWWAVLCDLAAGCACGRLAAGFACRRGVPAASETGLGAMVAGTVGAVELAYGLVATAAVALWAVPDRAWQGPVAVLAGIAVTVGLVWHVRRRIGGINGDVLGACVEVATAVTLIGFVLG